MYRPFIIVTIAAASVAHPSAQAKHPPAPAEWGQFENLAIQPRAGLSPDGTWLAYGINRSNRENELRIRHIASGAEKTIAFATQPSFSADSTWVAYSIGYTEAQEERMRTQRRPIHRKLGVLKLDGQSDPMVIDGIESFTFDPSGKYLAMRRYAPERQGSNSSNAPAQGPVAPSTEGATDEPVPTGVTILVRNLATGADTTFGNVGEFAWQNVTDSSAARKPLLALTISTEDKTGNGVQLYDAGSGIHRVLDSSASIYTGLAWRRDADDLAVLRSQSDEKREGSTFAVLAWKGAGDEGTKPRIFDPVNGLPAGTRTVSFRRPSWQDAGGIVFVGVAPWAEKPPSEKKDDAPAEGSTRPATPAPDDTPSVEIWHAKDVMVMPRQKLSARTDRQRNLLAAWHLDSGQLVQLGKDADESVVPIRRQAMAYAPRWDSYAMERTIGRRAADIALVDLRTGARSPIVAGVDDAYLQSSPGGRFLLYLHDDHFWTVNTASRTVTNITKAVSTSFVNRESDATVKQKPPFGVAGWTKDEGAVLLYDKFDVWEVAADGARATRLTNGAAEQVRHRVVRLDPADEWIDTSKPLTLSLFGIWSKKSGYARRAPGGSVETLLFEDRAVSSLAKAKDAEVYLYVTQKFDDSPDAYVGGPDLKSAKQVTNTNPFMSKYAWGRSETVEYKTDRGLRLQGSLHYPAGYAPGKKYPMVVYLYEKLSDNVHQFVPPSERDYYNESAFTSQGYLFFQPDIVFRPREPGLSVLECVEAALKKVISMGVVDPARIGVIGHSWGGFDAAYLSTHSKMFAAAVAGAAITNLVSNYGNHHWSIGIAETDHIETGQQRMEVPLYEDLQAYIRNSAVFNVHNMTTPLLLEVGDNDGTVHWHQGVEMYNIARRAKKNVVMLAYGGEDHGLRRRANQIDYHRRILQWFGHYLKHEPAAPWITSGLPYIDRDKELKKGTARKGS